MHPAVAANLGNVYAHLNRRAPAAVMFHLAASIYWREGRRQDELRCHLEAAWMLLLAGDHRTAAHDLEAASDLLHGHGGQDQVIRHRIATALHAYLAGDHLTAEETTIDLVQHSDLDHSQAADAAWLLSLLAYRKGDEGAGRRCAELAYEQALVGWDPLQLDRIAGLINEQRDPGGACLPDIAGKARHH
jgi:hypothetical protein